MAKKATITIDKILADLYTKGCDFNEKLSVAKEMVKLEMARLKSEPEEDGDKVPAGLRDDEEKK